MSVVPRSVAVTRTGGSAVDRAKAQRVDIAVEQLIDNDFGIYNKKNDTAIYSHSGQLPISSLALAASDRFRPATSCESKTAASHAPRASRRT